MMLIKMILTGISLICQKRRHPKKLRFAMMNFFVLIFLIKEEIRRLEMEGDFEAGAKLRQQLRDVRRAEKKAAEEAATKAAANAEQGCEPLP